MHFRQQSIRKCWCWLRHWWYIGVFLFPFLFIFFQLILHLCFVFVWQSNEMHRKLTQFIHKNMWTEYGGVFTSSAGRKLSLKAGGNLTAEYLLYGCWLSSIDALIVRWRHWVKSRISCSVLFCKISATDTESGSISGWSATLELNVDSIRPFVRSYMVWSSIISLKFIVVTGGRYFTRISFSAPDFAVECIASVRFVSSSTWIWRIRFNKKRLVKNMNHSWNTDD